MGSLGYEKSSLTALAQQLHLSPTLQINELVAQKRAKGHKVVHLGFGEATFPLQKDVLDRHRSASQQTSYLPVAGWLELREVSDDPIIAYQVAVELLTWNFIVHREVSNAQLGDNDTYRSGGGRARLETTPVRTVRCTSRGCAIAETVMGQLRAPSEARWQAIVLG
jgi:hypothetical protein